MQQRVTKYISVDVLITLSLETFAFFNFCFEDSRKWSWQETVSFLKILDWNWAVGLAITEVSTKRNPLSIVMVTDYQYYLFSLSYLRKLFSMNNSHTIPNFSSGYR